MGFSGRENTGHLLKGIFSREDFRGVRVFAILTTIASLGAFTSCTDHTAGEARAVEPQVVVTPQTPVVTAPEIRKLRTKLLSQQIREKHDLKKSQEDAVRTLSTAQKNAYRDWSANEKTLRRKFFTENLKGALRREYVRDFLKRRESLVQSQRDELAALKKKNENEMADLDRGAKEKRLEAEAYFREKRKPAFLSLDG